MPSYNMFQDEDSPVRRVEPWLVQSSINMFQGLGIVLCVEWVVLAFEIIFFLFVAVAMDVLSGIIGIIMLIVGIIALLKLNQGRIEDDGECFTFYCCWKTVVLAFGAIGCIIDIWTLCTLSEATNHLRSSLIISLILAIVYLSIGAWFLSFVARCRVYLIEKSQRLESNQNVSMPIVTVNPGRAYGQFQSGSSQPGIYGREPAGYGSTRAQPATQPPTYDQANDGGYVPPPAYKLQDDYPPPNFPGEPVAENSQAGATPNAQVESSPDLLDLNSDTESAQVPATSAPATGVNQPGAAPSPPLDSTPATQADETADSARRSSDYQPL